MKTNPTERDDFLCLNNKNSRLLKFSIASGEYFQENEFYKESTPGSFIILQRRLLVDCEILKMTIFWNQNENQNANSSQ